MVKFRNQLDPSGRAERETEVAYLAFRDKLLFLNAVFEAAREGEAGAGFAVAAGKAINSATQAFEEDKESTDTQ